MRLKCRIRETQSSDRVGEERIDMVTATVIQTGSGSNNDQVRRHNLSVVLGLSHRTGGLSRAQLTRQTGLNRSTVAALWTRTPPAR